jgi:hypothetical protein
MSGDAYFLDVSKIAVTIAGFVGVVGALRHKRDEEWKLNEVYGMKLMIEHSLAAVLVGLLPSVAGFAFDDQPAVWVLCSVALALFLAFEAVVNIFRVKQSTAAGTPPRAFILLVSTFFVPTVIVLFLQVENALRWQKPFVVACGALWLLVAGGIQFMQFLMRVKIAHGA